MRRVRSQLALGMRLALAGGASSRLRAALTALGVGLGVALLLGAASIPSAIEGSRERAAARAVVPGEVLLPRGPRTLLVSPSDTAFRGQEILGRDLQPDGAGAPVPPGLRALPAAGEVVVSPALRDLLARGDARLLRERLGPRVVGLIAPAGLRGPAELAFYRGARDLPPPSVTSPTVRIARFGGGPAPEGLGPLLALVVAIAIVVLLLPVGVFVAAAVRFGGEDRDRRLAALRLVGADRGMTARIAAGEALLGALGGVAAGVGLFAALRPLAARLSFEGLSAPVADLRPDVGLAALVLTAVPAAAVVVSLAALRGVVVEPLGVVRRAAATRRRLWWRVVPAVLAVVLLLDVRNGLSATGGGAYQAAAGVLCGLVAITAVLPWLVEVVVGRMGRGPLSWQLAVRRLQADGGTGARVVSGIAVAVAGAIALQTLFSAAERESRIPTGVAEQRQGQVVVNARPGPSVLAPDVAARMAATRGVRFSVGAARTVATPVGRSELLAVVVADCATLRRYARVTRCTDGAVFLPPGPSGHAALRAGARLRLGAPGGPQATWVVPAGARRVAAIDQGGFGGGDSVLATPGALAEATMPGRRVEAFVGLTPGDPAALDRVRNVALRVDPRAGVYELRGTDQTRAFTTVRRALFLGAVGVLALIGASLLVGALEQLRERRRVLAVLVAFGTRRGTMAASVLWQVAVPVTLGLGVAVTVGTALGVLLLGVASQPVSVDWTSAAALVAAGFAIVALVTLASLPALWRLMRPDGLRTE